MGYRPYSVCPGPSSPQPELPENRPTLEWLRALVQRRQELLVALVARHSADGEVCLVVDRLASGDSARLQARVPRSLSLKSITHPETARTSDLPRKQRGQSKGRSSGVVAARTAKAPPERGFYLRAAEEIRPSTFCRAIRQVSGKPWSLICPFAGLSRATRLRVPLRTCVDRRRHRHSAGTGKAPATASRDRCIHFGLAASGSGALLGSSSEVSLEVRRVSPLPGPKRKLNRRSRRRTFHGLVATARKPTRARQTPIVGVADEAVRTIRRQKGAFQPPFKSSSTCAFPASEPHPTKESI